MSDLFVEEPISEFGYSIFTTGDGLYRKLTEVLVDSLLSFGSFPIHVTVVNGPPIPAKSGLLSTSITTRDKGIEWIYYSKFAATLLAPFETVLQMDADMIAGPVVDRLFELRQDESPYPLGALHPQDPDNQRRVMEFLKVKDKSQPYVHATYLAGWKARPFIAECLSVASKLVDRRRLSFGYRPPNFDETILNVMLWRDRVSDAWLPFFDPYYSFFARSHDPSGNAWQPYERSVSHGLKCPTCATFLLDQLRQSVAEHPWTGSEELFLATCNHTSSRSLPMRTLTRGVRSVRRRLMKVDLFSRSLDTPRLVSQGKPMWRTI